MDPTVLMPSSMERKTIVVVGLGMVGLSFIEKILEYDTDKYFDIVTFSEESIGNALSIISPALSLSQTYLLFSSSKLLIIELVSHSTSSIEMFCNN